MNKTKRDKIQVGLIMGVSLAVIISAVVMAIYGGVLDNMLLAIVTILLVGISAIFLIYAAKAMFRDINKGIPFRDERSRRVIEKAAGNSFIVMIYLLLAIGWYSDNSSIILLPTDVTGIGILGGSVSFAVFWVFFNRKASLD